MKKKKKILIGVLIVAVIAMSVYGRLLFYIEPECIGD